jgi:phosphatidylethanolamine-binding protein (PEBP) family uncharacterized protein
MSRVSRSIVGPASILVFVLTASGCGSSSANPSDVATTATATGVTTTASSTATPATSSANLPTVDIEVKSNVSLEPLPAHFTCDGANVSLPITWGRVPPGTAEVDLFVFNVQPVDGSLFASWAVAGLKPNRHKLLAGELPGGAVLGRNSAGQIRYSVCPPKGKAVQYVAQLYALPHKTGVARGFTADAVSKRDFGTARSIGRLYFSYKRR